MLPIGLILILILALPFLILMLNYDITGIAFVKLGIPKDLILFIFLASLLGGFVNIPLWKRKIKVERQKINFFNMIFYYPAHTKDQTIYLNLGGAVVPILLSLFLLPKAELIPLIISTVIVVIISKLLARPVEGVGIAMPAFIPPIVAAVLAMILAKENPAAVAYISGVIGVLVGADILNLNKILKTHATSLSIGGAGVFDGIFLVGIISALLA